MRDQIEELDIWNGYQPEEDIEDQSEPLSSLDNLHISLGSKQKSISLQALENLNNDLAFKNIRRKLVKFFKELLPSNNLTSVINPEMMVFFLIYLMRILTYLLFQITPYNFIKVTYESKVDWKAKTDYLRCNPLFHGQPRYDYIMVDTAQGEIFAQLLYIFICKIDDTDYPLALIHPYDEPIEEYPDKDEDLGLYRIQAGSRKTSEFISVESIIRGALVVDDFETENQFLVVDVVDSDMFIRMQELLAEEQLV